jgi:hypothetical protein
LIGNEIIITTPLYVNDEYLVETELGANAPHRADVFERQLRGPRLHQGAREVELQRRTSCVDRPRDDPAHALVISGWQ